MAASRRSSVLSILRLPCGTVNRRVVTVVLPVAGAARERGLPVTVVWPWYAPMARVGGSQVTFPPSPLTPLPTSRIRRQGDVMIALCSWAVTLGSRSWSMRVVVVGDVSPRAAQQGHLVTATELDHRN